VTSAPPAELIGVVLAGGSSLRMGEDKGGLRLDGVVLANRCATLLAPLCAAVCYSVRESQADLPQYRGQPHVIDDERIRGPAAGLLAAWRQYPQSALLALAVDLARVDAPMLSRLVDHRNAARIATAFRHADGIVEPLCTIWEPAAADIVSQAADRATVRARSPSLRRVLEQSAVAVVDCPDPGRLKSCNTPEAFAAAAAAWSSS
jgi:molybdopterin-guanine dinucleotide biosynthesis protein A